jgi:hypothetical protein
MTAEVVAQTGTAWKRETEGLRHEFMEGNLKSMVELVNALIAFFGKLRANDGDFVEEATTAKQRQDGFLRELLQIVGRHSAGDDNGGIGFFDVQEAKGRMGLNGALSRAFRLQCGCHGLFLEWSGRHHP